MKKIIFIGLIIISSLELIACDICNIYLGVNPNDYKHRIGVFHRSRFLNGTYSSTKVVNNTSIFRHFGNVSTIEELSKVKELYNVYELQGKFFISPKISVIASVPIVNNYRSVNAITTTDIWHIGDPTIIGRYQLLSTKSIDTTNVVHRLLAGVGFKLPIAPFEMKYNEMFVDEDLQPGSGSFDILLTLQYLMKFKNGFGMSAMATTKMNTPNYKKFQFGNSFNANMDWFYQIKTKRFRIVPNIGTYWEFALKDKLNKEIIEVSGGQVLFASAGCNLYFKGFELKGAYQYAVYNQLKPGQIPVLDRFTLGLFYSFN